MRKFLSILIVICLSINLISCDFKDIDKRLFIIAIGIDSADKEGEIRVTFKAALPRVIGQNSSDTKSKNFEAFTVVGKSFGEITRLLEAETYLKPDFGHMKILVFGAKYAAENDVTSAINFFTSRRDIQFIAHVAVGMPDAKALLSLQPSTEIISGNSLFLRFNQGSYAQYAIDTQLKDVKHSSDTPGFTLFCPILHIKDNHIVLTNIALFYKGKLSLVLNKEESKLFKLLFEGTNDTYLSVTTMSDTSPVGIKILNGSTKIKLKQDDSSIICEVHINIRGILEEFPHGMDFKPVIAEAERLLNSNVKSFLTKLQNNKLDPLQLQIKYWSNNPKYEFSEEWLENEYGRINFKVSSDINITSAGLLR